MRITITITRQTPVHINFYIFVNGGRAGEMILRTEEYEQFISILQPDKIYDNSDRTDITTITDELK